MVFTAPLYTTSTTGTRAYTKPEEPAKPVVDLQAKSPLSLSAPSKHDVAAYTMFYTPFISLAGVAAGAQEAYYKFERMPPSISRPVFSQAAALYGIVAKKTLYATALGALFCATDAMVENSRGKHDFTSGIAAGLVTGLAFGMGRSMPQPIVWPVVFAASSVLADIVAEKIPQGMKGFKTYGALEGRPEWNDPEPPRPPIMDTGATARPAGGQHFWRGQ